MKQKFKRICSMVITICMLLAMLPAPVYAGEGERNFGTSAGTSGGISAFSGQPEDMAEQAVYSSTTETALRGIVNSADDKPSTDGTRIYANGVPVVVKEVGGTVNMYKASDTGFTEALFTDIGGKTIYAGWQDGDHTGDTSLTILSGTFNSSVYGGSREGTITGDTNLDIQGGTFNYNIFGGSALTGAAITGCAKVTAGNAVFNNCTVFGGGYLANTAGSTDVTVKSGSYAWVYGGGNAGSVTGKAKLTVDGGTFTKTVFGGSDNGTVGRTDVTINGGVFEWLYGGGWNGPVTGNTNITVNGGAFSETIFGGCAKAVAPVGGDTNILINSGTFIIVRGGGYEGSVTGDTHVTVNGGVFWSDRWQSDGTVYGGGYEGNVRNANITVNATDDVMVNGGSTKKTLFIQGGGNYGYTEKATIDINGGNFATVYGGGLEKESVTGAANITIGGESKVRLVYGGGYMGGVTGDVSIVIEDEANIADAVYGGCANTMNSDLAPGHTPASVVGAVGIILKDNASVEGHIFGGGNGGSVGSANIQLLGGTVGGHRYMDTDMVVHGGGQTNPLYYSGYPSTPVYEGGNVTGAAVINVYPEAATGGRDFISLKGYGDSATVGEGSKIVFYHYLNYDANGGTGTVPAQSYMDEGNTFEADSNMFTAPAGKQFKEWNTSPDGGGTSYAAGGTVTMPPQDLTLYALWDNIPTYTVTVSNGTGGGSYAAGDTVTIIAAPPSEGKGFKEWSISSQVTFVENTDKVSQTAKFIMPAQAVTAAAIYEDLSATTYTITVQNDGNGTAGANANSAEPGDEITLTATANSGYKFKEWQVISGGVAITGNKFTMPAEDVTVKAIFEEEAIVADYGVTVAGTEVNAGNKDNIAGPGITGSVSYDPDSKTLTLDNAVITSDSQITNAIYSENDITVELVDSSRLGTDPKDQSDGSDYTIRRGIYAPGKTITLTGSGSLEIYDYFTGIEAEKVTVGISGTLKIKERGNYGKACCLKADGGALTVQNGALDLSSYYSNSLYGDSIVINGGTLTAHSFAGDSHNPLFAFNRAPSFGSGYSHKIFAGSDADSAQEISNPSDEIFTASKYVRIEPKTSGGNDDGDDDNGKDNNKDNRKDSSGSGTPFTAPKVSDTEPKIVFSPEALSSLPGDVKVTASKVDPSELSEEARQKVGSRPVFDITVTVNGKVVSEFGGPVTVSVPYTPGPDEDLNAIVAYYINPDGKPELLNDCRYDIQTGSMVFTTDHLSRYAVGYNKVSFGDVAENDWYAKAVTFIAAREITSGTGDGNFNPRSSLTRGQFIVLVMKACGIAPDANPQDNFADAKDTWYTDYLAAAKNLGISQGTGNNMFEPDKEISRQELFTLLYGVLKSADKLPRETSGNKLSDFSDAGEVASWAKNAAEFLIESGTISGGAGSLNPSGTATRSEMAQILYRLISK